MERSKGSEDAQVFSWHLLYSRFWKGWNQIRNQMRCQARQRQGGRSRQVPVLQQRHALTPRRRCTPQRRRGGAVAA